AIARHDLGRRWLSLQPKVFADQPLELRVARGVGPDGSGELPDEHPLQREREPRPAAVELEGPPGQLDAERRRLGVYAVRARDHRRAPVLEGAADDCRERTLDPLEDQGAGVANLER